MIEYEKDIQWNLDPNFYNPVNLIEGVNNTIQNYAKNIAYNRVVNLNENIAIRLDASYENGLVFHVSCIVDPGANKYNTYTLADLIVRNDGNVKFIISGVDARIHKSEVKPNGICLPVNEELVAAALAQLGQRIDGPVFDNKLI